MKQRTMNRIAWASVASIVGLVLVFVVAPLIPYMTSQQRMCAITGSSITTRTWFGIFQDHKTNTTSLEVWLRAREPAFERQWVPLSTGTYYLLGGYGCAYRSKPEIYSLSPYLDYVVRGHTDDQMAEFVRVLKGGTPDEQRLAVSAMSREILR